MSYEDISKNIKFNKKVTKEQKYCNTLTNSSELLFLDLKKDYYQNKKKKFNLIKENIEKPFENTNIKTEPNYNDKKFNIIYYKHENNKSKLLESISKNQDEKNILKSNFEPVKYPNYLESNKRKSKNTIAGVEFISFPNTYQNEHTLRKNKGKNIEINSNKLAEEEIKDWSNDLKSILEPYQFSVPYDEKDKMKNAILNKAFERYFSSDKKQLSLLGSSLKNDIEICKIKLEDKRLMNNLLSNRNNDSPKKKKVVSYEDNIDLKAVAENRSININSIVNQPNISFYKNNLFRSPLESYNALENNRAIENNFNLKILELQKIKNQPIHELISTWKDINNFNSSNIKVSNILNKNLKPDTNEKKSNLDLNDKESIYDERNLMETPKLNKDNIEEIKDMNKSTTQEKKTNVDTVSIVNNNCFGTYKYHSKVFPPGNSQFTFTLDKDNYELAYVIGGKDALSNVNDIWVLDIKKFTWSKIEQLGNSSTDKRYGHTTVYFKKKLIVFGGSSRYLDFFYMTDLEVFDLNIKKWIVPNSFTKNVLKLRKNHIAEVVGSYMIIHGGIHEDGDKREILNDAYILNLSNFKWNTLSIKTDSDIKEDSSIQLYNKNKHTLDIDIFALGSKENKTILPPFLAHHSSCVVLPDEITMNTKLNLYKFPDISKRFLTKYKEKGIFVFGGKFSDNNDDINGNLYVLRLGIKPLEWALIETDGKSPNPRYQFTMNFIEKLNIIIVHGGKNDSLKLIEKNKQQKEELIKKRQESESKESENKARKNERKKTIKSSELDLKLEQFYSQKQINNENKSSKLSSSDRSLAKISYEEFNKKDVKNPEKSLFSKACSPDVKVNNQFKFERETIDSNTDHISFSDTYVLNLLRYEWIRVEVINNSIDNFRLLNRFSHCSISTNDAVIIFGGLSEKVYIGSSLFVINLSKIFYYRILSKT